jgi:hypothetical protein
LQLDDDFGGFGSENAKVADVDDFLARERALLGDDATAFGGAPTQSAHQPEQHEDLLSPPPAQGARFDISSFERDDDPPARQPSNVSVTAHDDVSAFESQFPEVETEQPHQHQQAPPPPSFTVSPFHSSIA